MKIDVNFRKFQICFVNSEKHDIFNENMVIIFDFLHFVKIYLAALISSANIIFFFFYTKMPRL